MSMKAILVTSNNYKNLALTYGVEDPDELKDAIGFYVLADFGEDNQDISLLSKEDLGKSFQIVGKLSNDYIEVKRRIP